MRNLFFRTNLTPYRIDTYNALHKLLNCEFFFYWDKDFSQNHDMAVLIKECDFTPHYTEKYKFINERRKIAKGVWKILKKYNPEIVIVPEFQLIVIQVLLFKFLFRKKIKVISMCDDSYDMVKNHRDFTLIHRLARKIIVPFLDNILLVDKRTVDWYQEKYKKGIWLPIIRDERKEIKINGMIQPLTESIKLKHKLLNKRILLYIGRLVEVKNLHTLIDAIELTKSSFTTIIVGSGHLDKELKEYAKTKSKEIIFIGQQNSNEVRTWFQIADAFILPSTLEPYGAVTNEALIAGCYSIISIQAGSACLINETNGCHINPHSSFDISRKIDSFFTSYHKYKKINKENKMLFSFDSIITTVIQQIYA